MKSLVTPQQRGIDAMLRWGVVFSIFWLGGIGSFFALSVGWKAHRMILESGDSLQGQVKAWWCMIAGGLGTSIGLATVGIGLFNNFRGAL